MDNNFIFLQSISSTAISITYSTAINLINTNSVVSGQNYLITDCDPSLYGSSSSFNFGNGTEVIIQGLDNSNFSSQGYGKFYNPIYYNPNTSIGYNVFNSGSTYSISDIIIYGGRVWELSYIR